MEILEKKLNNPVWNSLNETHKRFSLECDGVKFYAPEYCSFAALTRSENSSKLIKEIPNLTNSFYVFGEKPSITSGLKFGDNLRCNQMIIENPIDIETQEHIVKLKSYQQKADLKNLVKSVLPTLFKNKSSDIGTFYGIYKMGKLVAVLGERMKMNEFTEISSVVTHPEHIGKGYAKQLLKHLTDQIFNENKIPYLHVLETNIGAIKLYEKLGFITRRKFDCWNIIQIN